MGHEIVVAAKESTPTPVGQIINTLHRAECACGWRGCWYTNNSSLERSIALHMARAAR